MLVAISDSGHGRMAKRLFALHLYPLMTVQARTAVAGLLYS